MTKERERMIANKTVKIPALLLISFAESGDEAERRQGALTATGL